MPEHERELGMEIAQRQLRVTFSNGEALALTLRFGMPVPWPDETCFFCPHEILGLPDSLILGGYGADSLQALQLSMNMADARIEGWAEQHDATVWWEENQGTGLGEM